MWPPFSPAAQTYEPSVGDIVLADYPLDDGSSVRQRCQVLYVARNGRLQVLPLARHGDTPARGKAVRYVEGRTARLVHRRAQERAA